MRLANKELRGGFKTDLLFYQSVQWIMKDPFGAARLTREVTDGWTQRRFEHGGHRFNMETPELSQQEIDSIPGAQASLGNLDSMKFEMLERINDRMYWSSQTGSLLAEYEELRQHHANLAGQSTAVVPAAEAQQASGAEGSQAPPAATELESVTKLQESHGIELRVASEVAQVEIVICKDKTVWLLSSQGKTIGKHTVLGGFGTGQWMPEAECSEAGIPFSMPQGDKSIVQLDESSFAPEAQGHSTLSLYKLLLRAEAEKGVTEHRFSFLEIKRKESVQAGEDGFNISIKAPMCFRCLRDPRSQAMGGDREERVSMKNVFSKCLGPTFPRELAFTVFRYRFERVGQTFKIQRPYLILAHALTLQKEKPLKLT
eukprot:s246_g16.t1